MRRLFRRNKLGDALSFVTLASSQKVDYASAGAREMLRLGLTLPNGQHSPSEPAKLRQGGLVAATVAIQFLNPVSPARGRSSFRHRAM